ncbi:MAG: hypothetical protein L0Z55_07315 [Planctomycetes bacterium]|nr:hypothetical protein [Planctomycetota bacterium]
MTGDTLPAPLARETPPQARLRGRRLLWILGSVYCCAILGWYFLGYLRSLERFEEPILRVLPGLRRLWESAG